MESKLIDLKNHIDKIRGYMIHHGDPRFAPLIARSNQLIMDIDHAIFQRENNTLGFAFLAPIAWAAVAAAAAGATKWISDAYTTAKSVESEQQDRIAMAELAAKYGPDQARAMFAARKQTSVIDKILWMLGLTITGYFLLQAMK